MQYYDNAFSILKCFDKTEAEAIERSLNELQQVMCSRIHFSHTLI